MTFSAELLANVAQEVLQHGVSMKVENGTEDAADDLLLTFHLNDLSVTFERNNESHSFYGMVFECLGRDFVVSSNGKVYVQSEEGSEVVSFQVTDKAFLHTLESYLQWRLNALRNLKV